MSNSLTWYKAGGDDNHENRPYKFDNWGIISKMAGEDNQQLFAADS